MTGTIIGAGFITGAELIGFFGTENFSVSVVIATILTAVVLLVVLKVLKNHKNEQYGVEKLLGGTKLYRISTCFASLVFTASMLAGIDALFNTVIDFGAFQFCSLIVITVISAFSKFGVKGLEKLNLFLMPLIIIAVNFLIFTKRGISVNAPSGIKLGNALKVTLYVFMNTFIAIPVMRETVKNKSKKTLIISSVAVSIIIGFEAYTILSAIKNSGTNLSAEMPLYSALIKGGFSLTFFTSIFFCSLTSAFSAYYPLYTYAREKGKTFGIIVSAIFTVAVSKLGLNGIVQYAYPIVGGLGALFFVRCLFSIKNKTNADNNSIHLKCGGYYVKKKKEQKQSN